MAAEDLGVGGALFRLELDERPANKKKKNEKEIQSDI